MSEPIHFVIERTAGGEVACIYRDLLPGRLTRKIPKGSPERPLMIYHLRLDRLDPQHRDFWLRQSTVELLATYHWLRDEGTLPPPNTADPPREKAQTGRKFGDWWTPPKRPWDSKEGAQ